MKYPFQQLSRTNAPLESKLCEAAERVIRSGWYLRGCETERFEHLLTSTIGTRHAVGTGNGLDAIRLIFRALLETGRVRAGSEVIIPANTFIATVLPIRELGFRCRVCDIDPATMNLDWGKLEGMISECTSVVVPVHLYGTPAWDFEVCRRLAENGVILVEDNAQAIGASVTDPEGNVHMTGALGAASAISFYPGKNIGALGDAGAVCTGDAELAECIRMLGNYGSRERYVHGMTGYNSRIDEIQAAMLSVKLEHSLESETEARNLAAATYNECITNPGIEKPRFIPATRQVWHQYVVRTNDRDRLQHFLADNGVETMIHYPTPIHKQVCMQGKVEGDCPIAEREAHRILSLPIANITPAEAKEISEIINKYK